MPSWKAYLGIDCGKNGGIALLGQNNICRAATPMPTTETDIWNWFQHPPHKLGLQRAIIENPGFGHPGSSKSNVAKMYGNYTLLRGFLIAAGIPFEAVTARTWQKALKIRTKGKNETRALWKNHLKARAQELFPDMDVTLATADALLIAEYCHRFHQAML